VKTLTHKIQLLTCNASIAPRTDVITLIKRFDRLDLADALRADDGWSPLLLLMPMLRYSVDRWPMAVMTDGVADMLLSCSCRFPASDTFTALHQFLGRMLAPSSRCGFGPCWSFGQAVGLHCIQGQWDEDQSSTFDEDEFNKMIKALSYDGDSDSSLSF